MVPTGEAGKEHRGTVFVSGQLERNISVCAAISETGVICHVAAIGPRNTACLFNLIYNPVQCFHL